MEVMQQRERLQLQKNSMIHELKELRKEYKFNKEDINEEKFEMLKLKYKRSNMSNLSESQRLGIASTIGSQMGSSSVRKNKSVKRPPHTIKKSQASKLEISDDHSS